MKPRRTKMDPRILVSEVDGLRRYRPELLMDGRGREVWAQECAELIGGRWEGFMNISRDATAAPG